MQQQDRDPVPGADFASGRTPSISMDRCRTLRSPATAWGVVYRGSFKLRCELGRPLTKQAHARGTLGSISAELQHRHR
jgi:hypothetical protein